jgi:predicted AlkP superfamily phosphohydrolase/phosphomutase
VVFALYAGARRKRRPHGLLQGAATGGAMLFAAIAYVALAWVPADMQFARNLRSGEAFWKTLDRSGVRCVALEAPLGFPADEMHDGACLCGLGVPDVQRSWGFWSVWTDDPETPVSTETGGTVFFVDPAADTFDVVLSGPPAPLSDPSAAATAAAEASYKRRLREMSSEWTPVRRRASQTDEEILELTASKIATARLAARRERGKSLHLTTSDGTAVDLAPRVWSELVPVTFKLTPLVALKTRVRFYLDSAGAAPTAAGEPWQPMRLFVTPVQFDPAALPPPAQIASPASFAKELADASGPFDTLGWPELTSPVKDDMLADRAFVDHIDLLRRSREKRLMASLAKDDWDCLFALFSEPDRVQHALYRHIDEKSPRHDASAAAEFGGEIDRAYVEMDRLVGEVVKATGPNTNILVCSDHGFAPFRRGVNLNNFLESQSLQVRIGGAASRDLRHMGSFEDVNWAETKAYAMGLGNIYLNRKGREPMGIVADADAEKVMLQIEAGLLALRDKDGAKVVRHVYRGAKLYHGARAGEAPDLVVGFEWGYRVSWQTCLGGCEADVIADNPFRWSGDHCSVDPELVPGVLFSSMPLDPLAAPQVTDVMPTMLAVYGIPADGMDGRSLLAK